MSMCPRKIPYQLTVSYKSNSVEMNEWNFTELTEKEFSSINFFQEILGLAEESMFSHFSARRDQGAGDLYLSLGETYTTLVAIDFGTTFSGFAFSFNYKEGKNDIHMNREWGADQGLSTLKTPTCLLLNPDKSFNSFGYEAQDIYAELEEKEAWEYYYFRNFKMILHNDQVGVT